jgi:3-dehydrosphinganine reductase
MDRISYYNNKLALVTGGSSGIGLALAEGLAENGANIVIMARREQQLYEAVHKIQKKRKNGDQFFDVMQVDVANREAVSQAASELISKHGVPDFIFNSAGVCRPGTVQDLDLDLYHWMMDINFFGTLNIIKYFVPGMIKRRSGHIINLSSMAGFLGGYGYSAYGPSKFAVRGFSDVLRAEMKLYGVRVSVVFPPDVDTPSLANEKPYQPAILTELSKTTGMISAKKAADEILVKAAKGRYVILPGFESKLYFWLSNFMGRLVYPVMDMMIADANKKVNSK